VIPKPVTPSSL